jgi:hypothetical protein
MRERITSFKRKKPMFEAHSAATAAEVDLISRDVNADFRTPADPEAGWAARNPAQALVFLYVSPRDCGAIEELMAL